MKVVSYKKTLSYMFFEVAYTDLYIREYSNHKFTEHEDLLKISAI